VREVVGRVFLAAGGWERGAGARHHPIPWAQNNRKTRERDTLAPCQSFSVCRGCGERERGGERGGGRERATSGLERAPSAARLRAVVVWWCFFCFPGFFSGVTETDLDRCLGCDGERGLLLSCSATWPGEKRK